MFLIHKLYWEDKKIQSEKENKSTLEGKKRKALSQMIATSEKIYKSTVGMIECHWYFLF